MSIPGITDKHKTVPIELLQFRWNHGLLLFLIGLSLILFVGLALRSVIRHSTGSQENNLFLLPFFICGLIMMGWGHGVSIRRSSCQIRRWYGLVIPGLPSLPFYYRTIDASRIKSVLCYGKQWAPATGKVNKNPAGPIAGGYYEALIELETTDGQLVSLLSFSSPESARKTAKTIALFLDIPLAEHVIGGAVEIGPGSMQYLQPEELVLNLREREHRAPVESKDAPVELGRIRREDDDNTTMLWLPRGRLRSEISIEVAIALGCAVGSIVCIRQGIATVWFGLGLFLAITGSVMACSAGLGMILGSQKSMLALSGDRLVLQWFYPVWRRSSVTVPFDEIESIEEIEEAEGKVLSFSGPSGPAVRLVTGDRIMQFGWGLTDAERQSLCALLRAQIVRTSRFT